MSGLLFGLRRTISRRTRRAPLARRRRRTSVWATELIGGKGGPELEEPHFTLDDRKRFPRAKLTSEITGSTSAVLASPPPSISLICPSGDDGRGVSPPSGEGKGEKPPFSSVPSPPAPLRYVRRTNSATAGRVSKGTSVSARNSPAWA